LANQPTQALGEKEVILLDEINLLFKGQDKENAYYLTFLL
jgi:hypothetical protein